MKKSKNHIVSFEADEELFQQIKAYAMQCKVSKSNVIRCSLYRFFDVCKTTKDNQQTNEDVA